MKKLPHHQIVCFKTFRDYGLPDARNLPDNFFTTSPRLFQPSERRITVKRFSREILKGNRKRVWVNTPLEPVLIDERSIGYIAQKSERSKYARFFVPTLEDPNEIWLSYYPRDGSYRKRFFKFFKDERRRHILVIVKGTKDGSLFHNAFEVKQANYIDNQRCGLLLYWKEGRGESGCLLGS